MLMLAKMMAMKLTMMMMTTMQRAMVKEGSNIHATISPKELFIETNGQ